MADGGSKILRQLDQHWLECLDEQGIFYFNQATQQSEETMPQQFVGIIAPPAALQATLANAAASYAPPVVGGMPAAYAAPAAVPSGAPVAKAAKVIGGGIHATPGGNSQPSSYVPQPVASYAPPQQVSQVLPGSQPSSYVPPQQILVQQAVPVQQPLLPQHGAMPQQQVMMQQVQQPVLSFTPPIQVQPQAQPQPELIPGQPAPAVQKMAFGDWGVYEDELGRFYLQVSTGQQFESPPAQLMEDYKQYRAEQDRIHMQQLQQIEQQKLLIDQQLAQQTQSLQQRYGC